MVSDDRSAPNLYVYFTHTTTGGIVGIAWTGSACVSDYYWDDEDQAYYWQKQYRSSINAYLGNDLITAETLAHEIGHNFNMKHDFEEAISSTNKVNRYCPTDGSSCTDINGIMDYYETSPLSWTCCSRFYIGLITFLVCSF